MTPGRSRQPVASTVSSQGAERGRPSVSISAMRPSSMTREPCLRVPSLIISALCIRVRFIMLCSYKWLLMIGLYYGGNTPPCLRANAPPRLQACTYPRLQACTYPRLQACTYPRLQANAPPQGYAPVPPQGYAPAPPQGYAPAPPQGYAPAPPQGFRPVFHTSSTGCPTSGG